MRNAFVFAAILIAACGISSAAPRQIDCGSVLNARPVSVADRGKIVSWTMGIDGGGKADGFATVSAARIHGDPVEHALPDNGAFAADADHPAVQLPYGLAGAGEPQARALPGESTFDLAMPDAALGELFLFFTSAEGATQLSVVLHYADGTSDTQKIEMPDYYRAPVASDKNLFALAADLAKWNAAGKLAEADHHYIYGWKIVTAGRRSLKSITVRKSAGGYLVFWGATAR